LISVLVGGGGFHSSLRVEFLLKTDSGYPKDTGVNLFVCTVGTLARLSQSGFSGKHVFTENSDGAKKKKKKKEENE